jgi:NADH:ubiquinone oxidoreductase subunit E
MPLRLQNIRISVCSGHSCSGNLSRYTLERAQNEVSSGHLENIEVGSCPCQGKCETGPTVIVEEGEKKKFFSHVTPSEMGKIIRSLFS